MEWPQKFGVEKAIEDADDTIDDRQSTISEINGEETKVNLLSYLVERWASIIEDETEDQVGEFYPSETENALVGKSDADKEDGWVPVGYIWARTIPCQNPNCSAEIPLVRQFWVSKKDNKRIAYRPKTLEDGSLEFDLLSGERLESAIEDGFDPSDGTVHRGHGECLFCEQVTKGEEMREAAKEGHLGERLIASVYHHPAESQKQYRLATEDDIQTFEDSVDSLEEKQENWMGLDSFVPNEEVNPKRPSPNARGLSGVTRYNLTEFSDLFNKRQQLTLATFAHRIDQNHENILKDCKSLVSDSDDIDAEELAEAVTGYLGVILSRQTDYCSSFCVWETSGEFIAHTFGRQAIPMAWDYFEVNPFSGSTGDWSGAVEWVQRYIEKQSWSSNGSIDIRHASATDLPHPDDHFDAVITDPPYYDNVPYADLSDYFYVWLKRAVGDVFPDLFSTSLTPKSDEAVMQTSRHDSLDEAKSFFETMLGQSFSEMQRILKPGGVAVVVYAHKTTEGWETMLNGLVEAGLTVTASWPVHTERKSRLVASRSAALASSIYMVCRKTERAEVGYWSEIKPEIEENIEGKLEQFWENGIVGGDFFISAIGPGMEEFSKYKRVETYSGEEVDYEELLQYIRSVSADFLVERLIQDASSERIDEPAMFYLTYRWTYMDNKVDFDDAKKLANAEGVDLEQLWGSDGFVKKTRKYIHVHGPEDRGEIDRVENMVDAVHKAALLWEKGNKDELGEFLSSSGYGDTPAFWQFSQAIAECLVNGTKEKQLLEGLLMSRDDYEDYSPSRKDTTLEDFATEEGEQ